MSLLGHFNGISPSTYRNFESDHLTRTQKFLYVLQGSPNKRPQVGISILINFTGKKSYRTASFFNGDATGNN